MPQSKKTIFLSVLLVPLFFSGLFASFSPCKEKPPANATLEFWNVFDDSDVWQPLISAFSKQYPHITVNYRKKNITTYEQELIGALAAGRGPDIFAVHNTWFPKHKDKLFPAPANLITPKAYQSVFVDVAAQDFLIGDKIAALPFYVDTLALFYNKDLFNSAGIANPPQTWTEFNNAVKKLTTRDEQNNILQAGAALGTAKNINRSTDILALLMLQSGAKMVSSENNSAAFDQSVVLDRENFYPGKQALIYYTDFANPAKNVYAWNQNQHYSLDAFSEGKVAMTLNYGYQIPSLKSRAPHLNFAVAPLPQTSKTGKAITYANYWATAVSKASQNPVYAWQFLVWAASQENTKDYLGRAQKPTSRRDLIDWQKDDEVLGVFAEQSLTAKSWRQADNLAIETIFADMIESVVAGLSTPEDALRAASQQVTLLMQKRQE